MTAAALQAVLSVVRTADEADGLTFQLRLTSILEPLRGMKRRGATGSCWPRKNSTMKSIYHTIY